VLLAQVLYALQHRNAPRTRDHVSDHQNFHIKKVNGEWSMVNGESRRLHLPLTIHHLLFCVGRGKSALAVPKP
jgi:hypothetical protein